MPVVSHYRLLDAIGESDAAVVYRAEDLALGREVALKFLSAPGSSDYGRIARLQHEARTLSTLNHPNICTVHEIGEHEGRHFIAMEFVEGRPLSQLIGRQPLAAGRFVELALQIAAALEAAHAQQIVHRDLKPANILVTPRDHVKLLDFGVALPLPNCGARPVQAGTPAPARAGTLPYMSPEQVRGEDPDTRTDLFSLGTVMYEMATGVRPFSGATARELMDAILRQAPRPIRDLNPAVPPEIERIVDKALEKAPKLRYQTASDLCADLQRVRRDLEAASLVAARLRPVARGGAPPQGPRRAGGAQGVVLTATIALTVGGVLLGRWVAPPAEAWLTSRPIASHLALLPVAVRAPAVPEEPVSTDQAAIASAAAVLEPAASPMPAPAAAREALQIARQKIALRLYDQALEGLHRTVETAADPETAIDALLLIASVHETRRDTEDAMSAYVEIAGRFPDDPRAPEALYRLALATLASKRRERESEARRMLTQLAESYASSPWTPRALMARAELEDKLNLYQGDPQLGIGVPSSLVTYREIVQRYGSSDAAQPARVRLARDYLKVRRFAEAAATFEAVAARDPDNQYDAWFDAGEIFERELADPDRARRAYARVPASSPRYREARKRLQR